MIADSVGREARRQLVGEVVRAWVDEIPEQELVVHYAKAIAELDEHDLTCSPPGTPRSRSASRSPTATSWWASSRASARTAARR